MEEAWEFAALVMGSAAKRLKAQYPHISPLLIELVTSVFKNSSGLIDMLEESIWDHEVSINIPKVASPDPSINFEDALFLSDLFELIFMSCQLALTRAEGPNILLKSEKADQRLIVLIPLMGRALADLKGIRLLLLAGLPQQAMVLTRSYFETLMLLQLCYYDEEVRTEFVAAKNAAEAKHFFFKIMSKGRAEKKLAKRFEQDETYTSLVSLFDGMTSRYKEELGAAVHPSYYLSMDTLFSNMQEIAESDERLVDAISSKILDYVVLQTGVVLMKIGTELLPTLKSQIDTDGSDHHKYADFAKENWLSVFAALPTYTKIRMEAMK